MRVVRPDLIERALKSVRSTTEWPCYSIFVALSQYDSLVIASRPSTHGDLFTILRQEWISENKPDLELVDSMIFDGHIEWEDDFSFLIRTQRGTKVPAIIEAEIRNALKIAES